MIDIHCHILPGIDDGAANVNEALKMAKAAVKDGVRTIIATPHCYDGVYSCEQYDIVSLCNDFNSALAANGLPLTVLPGAEVRLTPEFAENFLQGNVMSLGGTGRAVLLELPEMFIPDAVVRVIELLQNEGVRCIIAHPERNALIRTKRDILSRFLMVGAEVQLTAGSLTGFWGRDVKNFSVDLLQQGVRGVLGSDGHCSRKRKPVLAKALKNIAKAIGRDQAEAWLENSHDYIAVNNGRVAFK